MLNLILMYIATILLSVLVITLLGCRIARSLNYIIDRNLINYIALNIFSIPMIYIPVLNLIMALISVVYRKELKNKILDRHFEDRD